MTTPDAAAPAGAPVLPAPVPSAPVRFLRGALALLTREFTAYFKSPVGWFIMFFFYLVTGVIFVQLFESMNRPGMAPTEYPMLGWFQMTLFLALTVMLPAVTMRLFSEEMRTGTLETLVTAPVTDLQVVLAKFVAALAYYVVLLAPTLVYATVLASTSQPTAPDRGPFVAGYVGLFFVGAFFLALGTFASACTRNQIVAFIGTFMAILVLQLTFVVRMVTTSDGVKRWLKPLDFLENFTDFGRGVIDTRHMVYYLAMTTLFLFLSVGMLGARKWRQ